MRRIKDNRNVPVKRLSREQADSLLNHILDDLHLKTDVEAVKRKRNFRKIVVRRHILKCTAALSCAVLLSVLLAPGAVVPASVSSVSAAPASDSSSVQVQFRVDTLIPVRDITAQINEHSLAVEESGYQSYCIVVEENGYLLLDIYSVTGMHSSHSMEISGIDDQAPVIVNHRQQDGQILLYLSDGDGSGVDYDSITAYYEDTQEAVTPVWYSEAEGCVAFMLPEHTIFITIPDKNGNYRVLSLSPA